MAKRKPITTEIEWPTGKTPIQVETSDNHLQVYNWAKYPDLHSDSFYSFSQIVAFCCNHELPLLLAGDVINVKRPDPRTVGFIMDTLDSMAERELAVRYIQGQHEMSRDRPWLQCHTWPKHISNESYSIGNIVFYGLDYCPPDQLAEELLQIPGDANVFVAHQVWRENMGPNLPSEASFAEVPWVSHIVTGDYHAHRVTRHKGKTHQDLTVISPGSTYMLSLDEDPKKYFFVMFDDLSVMSVPLKTRPIHRARLLQTDHLDQFMSDLPLIGDKVDHSLPSFMWQPIWHIEYMDDIPNIVARLEEAAKGQAHLFLRPMRKLTKEQEKEVNSEVMPTLEGYLPRCIEPEKAEYRTALRLLRANDVEYELKKIVDEVTVEVTSQAEGNWDRSHPLEVG